MKANITLSPTPFNNTKSLSPAAGSRGIFLSPTEGFVFFSTSCYSGGNGTDVYLEFTLRGTRLIFITPRVLISISSIENEIKSSKALPVNKSGNSNVNLSGYVMTVCVRFNSSYLLIRIQEITLDRKPNKLFSTPSLAHCYSPAATGQRADI